MHYTTLELVDFITFCRTAVAFGADNVYVYSSQGYYAGDFTHQLVAVARTPENVLCATRVVCDSGFDTKLIIPTDTLVELIGMWSKRLRKIRNRNKQETGDAFTPITLYFGYGYGRLITTNLKDEHDFNSKDTEIQLPLSPANPLHIKEYDNQRKLLAHEYSPSKVCTLPACISHTVYARLAGIAGITSDAVLFGDKGSEGFYPVWIGEHWIGIYTPPDDPSHDIVVWEYLEDTETPAGDTVLEFKQRAG